jgi:hypothetical protein
MPVNQTIQTDVCCEFGGVTVYTQNQDHLCLNADPVRTNSYPVAAASGPYVKGEVVKINAAGEIAKLAAAPAAGDILRIVVYPFTNTAASAVLNTATPKATVYVQGLFNEKLLVLPSGVTPAQAKAVLAANGLEITTPVNLQG